MKIRTQDQTLGDVTLGLGWNTWAWRGLPLSEKKTWEQMMSLFAASRCQWVRLDVRQSDWEPRDSRVEGYNFETPRMKALYYWLDACEQNGIDVLWANYYTSDSSLYSSDPASAWMSCHVQESLVKTGKYPEKWPRNDEPADHDHFVESFVEVLHYLITVKKYSCIKQISLFNEATSDFSFADHNPWPFYRKLHVMLKNRGLREQIRIVGPDDHNVPSWFWSEFIDFPVDIVAFHDYWNLFDANKVESAKDLQDYQRYCPAGRIGGRGLGAYTHVANGVNAFSAKQGLSVQLAITEYGHTGGDTWHLLPTNEPSEVFRGVLSMKCFLCEILKLGYGGALRWSHWPASWGHSYGPVAVQGVYYAPDNKLQGAQIKEALKNGAPLVTVPFVYEPERLVNTVIRRGDRVISAKVNDIPLGIHWVALQSASGEKKLFIANLRNQQVDLEWEDCNSICTYLYYAGEPEGSIKEEQVHIKNNTPPLSLPPRSLNGLIQKK